MTDIAEMAATLRELWQGRAQTAREMYDTHGASCGIAQHDVQAIQSIAARWRGEQATIPQHWQQAVQREIDACKQTCTN